MAPLSATAVPAPDSPLRIAADKVAARWITDTTTPLGNYTHDLALESLLTLSQTTGEPRYAAAAHQIIEQRKWTPESYIPWTQQPFSCLTWELYLQDKNPRWISSFLNQTRLMLNMTPRGGTGAIVHADRSVSPPSEAVLIDSFQEYIARCAKAGYASGDLNWFDEVQSQIAVHKQLLRNPTTTLWHNAYGWGGKTGRTSPGAWSRGHGWLLRGLSEVLRYTPRSHPTYTETRALVIELATALLKVQASTGYWHAMLQRPHSETPQESSGTGMIVFYLARLIQEGHLPREPFAPALLKAATALLGSVAEDGTPLDTCEGPGPLVQETNYLSQERFKPGNAHGYFSLIYGFCGGMMLESPPRPDSNTPPTTNPSF